MLVKLRQELLEVGIKDIDAKLDILDVAAEQLNEERLMYKVGEADKGAGANAWAPMPKRDRAGCSAR